MVAPNCLAGIGTAMVNLALMPLFAILVDLRHTAEYGNVYAISDAVICLGLALGISFHPFAENRYKRRAE